MSSQRLKRQQQSRNDDLVPSKRRKGRGKVVVPVESSSDSEGGPSNVWTPGPLSDLKMSNIYNRSAPEAPAELFRKDLISAMKIPDSEPLAPDEYWTISDTWKQEWESGVQVPVNPNSLPEPAVTVVGHRLLSPRRSEFKLPKGKLVRITKNADFSAESHYLSNAPAEADRACFYDLDDVDVVWLTNLNGERALMGSWPIHEDQLERMMEELEVTCWKKIQSIVRSEEGLGIEFDENTICDVCRSPDSEEGNEMVFCDCCNICVHQACYGITAIPAGSWLCRTCSLSIRPECVLCPNRGGAMKCTRSGHKWAHVSCALWIPEVSIGSVERMEPITKISAIPPSRWALVCTLCRDKVGACIQCSVKSCKTAYHVTCGFKHGLEMKAIVEDDADDGVKLRSYCGKHSKSGFVNKRNKIAAPEAVHENRKRKRKELSEEQIQAKAAKLIEIEATFDKHVSIKDLIMRHFDLDQEAVTSIYNYWKIKRRAGGNRPLISPPSDDPDLLGKTPAQADQEKLRMFVQLRQDLERVRNLCYMVSRREKLSRSFLRAREQTFHKQVTVLGGGGASALSKDEVTSVLAANHGPSIYDTLYSHDQENREPLELEQLIARIVGPQGSGASIAPNIYKRNFASRRHSLSSFSTSDSEAEAKRSDKESKKPLKAASSSSSLNSDTELVKLTKKPSTASAVKPSIYSDSSTDSDDEATKSNNVRTKAAVKDFLPSKKKSTTSNATKALIVPQRQAAKKASESMKQTTTVRPPPAIANEEPKKEEQRPKVEKEKENKRTKKEDEAFNGYVPQRAAAKKATESIKCGMEDPRRGPKEDLFGSALDQMDKSFLAPKTNKQSKLLKKEPPTPPPPSAGKKGARGARKTEAASGRKLKTSEERPESPLHKQPPSAKSRVAASARPDVLNKRGGGASGSSSSSGSSTGSSSSSSSGSSSGSSSESDSSESSSASSRGGGSPRAKGAAKQPAAKSQLVPAPTTPPRKRELTPPPVSIPEPVASPLKPEPISVKSPPQIISRPSAPSPAKKIAREASPEAPRAAQRPAPREPSPAPREPSPARPQQRSIFSPQHPSNELEDFEKEILAVDETHHKGLPRGLAPFSEDAADHTFSFVNDVFFKEDTKEDSTRETLNLVEKLRLEYAKKTTEDTPEKREVPSPPPPEPELSPVPESQCSVEPPPSPPQPCESPPPPPVEKLKPTELPQLPATPVPANSADFLNQKWIESEMLPHRRNSSSSTNESDNEEAEQLAQEPPPPPIPPQMELPPYPVPDNPMFYYSSAPERFPLYLNSYPSMLPPPPTLDQPAPAATHTAAFTTSHQNMAFMAALANMPLNNQTYIPPPVPQPPSPSPPPAPQELPRPHILPPPPSVSQQQPSQPPPPQQLPPQQLPPQQPPPQLQPPQPPPPQQHAPQQPPPQPKPPQPKPPQQKPPTVRPLKVLNTQPKLKEEAAPLPPAPLKQEPPFVTPPAPSKKTPQKPTRISARVIPPKPSPPPATPTRAMRRGRGGARGGVRGRGRPRNCARGAPMVNKFSGTVYDFEDEFGDEPPADDAIEGLRAMRERRRSVDAHRFEVEAAAAALPPSPEPEPFVEEEESVVKIEEELELEIEKPKEEPVAVVAPLLPGPVDLRSYAQYEAAPTVAPALAQEEPLPPAVEVETPEGRSQLKFKIKGPFLEQQTAAPTFAQQPASTDVRRMRKKELLRQYWTEEPTTTPGFVAGAASPQRTTITIPKAVASMTSIPTKEDYKSIVDLANLEKKKRKSEAEAAANKKRGRPPKSNFPEELPPVAPKLKIKIGVAGAPSTASSAEDDRRHLRVRPPKKRLSSAAAAPVPTLEELKKDSMKYRKQIAASFDKKSKKKKSRDAATGTPPGPKLIIRLGKPVDEDPDPGGGAAAPPPALPSGGSTDNNNLLKPIRLKLSRCDSGYVMAPKVEEAAAMPTLPPPPPDAAPAAPAAFAS